MYIHRADTGLVYNIEVDSSISVTQLKESLRIASKIPPEDQILLCDGTKLDNNNTLKFYGLPDDNKHVFLYDRKSLEPDSPAPEEVVLPSVELKVAPVPPLPRNQELEYKESPLLWQLITFENQFLGDLNNSEALKKVVEARIDICKSLLSEQENQVKGLNAAIANLNDHLNQITQAFGAFHTYYKQLQTKHEHLLRSFDGDMQKLRETKLHPALARSRMTTLMDFVPEARLTKWAQDCANEHDQLKSLVIDLEKQINFVRDGAESENKTAPEVDFNMLRSQIKRANDVSSEVTLRYHIFSNDYSNVRQRVQEAKSNDNLNKQSLWEICESFEQISREHKRQLAQMNDHDQMMKSIMSFCAASKTKLSRCVHDRLRSIAVIQSKIRELANKIIVFNEAVARQKTAFQQLVYVQSMPKAYHAAIEEVSHRRRFRRNISALASKFLETVSKLKDDETQRRQQFLSTYGRYVPKDIIPGLNSGVPAFEFEVPQFDNQLPQIDLPNDNNNASNNQSDSLGEEDFAMVLSSETMKSSRLQELERENDSLVNQIRALKADLNSGINLNSSSSGSSYQKSSVTASNVSNSSSTGSSADLVNDYKKRIESLELKLSTTYAQMEQAEHAAKEFREKWNTAEKEIRSSVLLQSKEQSSQLEAQIQQLEQDVRVLGTKLRETESSLEDSLAKESAFTVKLDIAHDTISEQHQQIKDYEAMVQSLQAQLSDVSAQLLEQTNQIKDLEENVNNLHIEKESYLNDYSSLQKQYESIQDEYIQLKQQQDVANNTVQSLDTKYAQAAKTESELKLQLAAISDLSSNQSQQISVLEEELKSLHQQNQSLQSQNQHYRDQVSLLQKQMSDLDQSKQTSEKKDLNYEKMLQDKDETLQKTLSELKTVSAKYTEAVKILEVKNKQNTELSQTKLNLEQRLLALEESKKTLTKELKLQTELVQHYMDSDQLARAIVQEITKMLQSTQSNNNSHADLLVLDNDNTVPKLLTELKQRVSELLHHCTVLESTVDVLKDKVSAFELQFEDSKHGSKPASQSKIVFSNFKPEDYIVFTTNKNGHYEVVNNKAPNFFLSPDVQEAILGENSKTKPPIFGQILHITDHVASSGSNPFSLPNGTTYHEVIIISEQ